MEGIDTKPLAPPKEAHDAGPPLLRKLRLRGGLPQAWKLSAALAALIALAPIVTIAGASILIAREKVAVAKLNTTVAPRVAAEQQRRDAHIALEAIVERPPLGSVVEGFARGLPSEASILRLEQSADGALEAEVRGGDPDALRAAIRREPSLAAMRNTNQRQTEAGMVITMRREAR